ncbi:hypothetical protein GCM10017567_75930 [Amycolatopsis bullii]|uniref:Uncharacterized protein n=1 Tax=Amycolatopsis bullii TaxID=941987 RepID=A0ABQ3KTS6_9PSEU|nr:hypothetical protein GCM10017567_75930 [Amycolatopsis bullii]
MSSKSGVDGAQHDRALIGGCGRQTRFQLRYSAQIPHEVRTWIAAYASLAATGAYDLKLRFYEAIPA